jgi:hypothetical protein
MPTSEKLLAAARENAKNSTGSRTPANTGSPPKIDHMEDPADLEAHRNAIHTLYNPQNQMGLFWVDQIVLAMWRIDKLSRWESGIFNDAISKTWEDNTDQDDEDAEDLEQYVTNTPPHEKHGVQNWMISYGMQAMIRKHDYVKTFLRYQSQASRLIRRAEDAKRKLRNEPIFSAQPTDYQTISAPENEPDSGSPPSPSASHAHAMPQ